MHNFDDEFREITSKIGAQEFPTETIDPTPYGGHHAPHKPGLTKRGKAAIALGGAILAGGALIGYQAYSSNTAEHEAKTQEIALQQQRIELDKLKELNRANNTQTSQNNTRQASVDKCVNSNKDLIGKGFNSSYRDIVDACQAQYNSTTNGDDMQAAASSQDADGNHSGGINEGTLIGCVVVVAGFVLVVKKGSRSNQA